MLISAARTLANWPPNTDFDRELYAPYVDFAADPATTHRESSVAQHLTASAFVFDERLENVLLCFHGKGRFWVQLGGHVDLDDASVHDAARREAREESGIDELASLSPAPVDLHRHALSAAFGTCRVHWDMGFAFTAARDAVPTASDESESVAWWPVDALPEGSVSDLAPRLSRMLPTLRAERGER